jgi:MFS transporter, SHS family, lactate transporter
MLSAPAAQIQTVAASGWIKETPRGPKPNYSQVMAIVMSIVFFSVAVFTACGQERLGSHFELVKRAGTEGDVIDDKAVAAIDNDRTHANDLELQKTACVHKEDV